MLARNTVALQVVLLLGAVILGLVLMDDIVDGPRTLHRYVGMAAGLVTIVSAYLVWKQSTNTVTRSLAIAAAVLTAVAGAAGNIGPDMFNLMRGAGWAALIASAILGTQLWNKSAK